MLTLDRMTVAIPDEWELYENQMGQTMVKAPWDWNYEIDEILQGNENPCFFAIDENMKGHRIYLKDAE